MAADGSDDVTDALIGLHAAVVRDLNTRAAKLPRTRSFTPSATVPALVLAQRLYGDATRADDIAARNFVRHPGFVPGGVELEVISAA
jgi:prophage DNA circulation protein